MTRRFGMIKRRPALALLGAAAVAVAAAAAPAGAQLQLGGSVPTLVALAIGTPTPFRRLAGGDVYQLTVPVRVTSTVDYTQLSIADGEDFSPPARGHLHEGAHLVSAPLEVLATGRAPQSLSAPTDPVLETWGDALALAPVTVVIRQPLPRGSITDPSLHKTVLITVSSETP
jgi:hypothetical protein